MSTDLRLLIIEDTPSDAELMVRRLEEEDFRPDWTRVENEADFLAALGAKPELILSDWRLPQFSGLRALQLLRQSGLEIPFVIISGSIGEEAAVEALHNGAFDYILKDRPNRLGSAVRRALENKNIRSERRLAEEVVRMAGERYRLIAENSTDVIWTLDRNFEFTYISPSIVKLRGLTPQEAARETLAETMTPESYRLTLEIIERAGPDIESGRPVSARAEIEQYRKDGSTVWVEIVTQPLIDPQGHFDGYVGVSRDITERKRSEKTLHETLARLRRVTGSIIDVVAKAVETRDPYTAGHQKRVSDLARAIGKRMALPAEQIEGIRVAGAIHDLGKISIPAEILSMPRKLSPVEFEMVKLHSQSGAAIVRGVEFDWPIAEIILQHHERMDGSGYPAGLKRGDILVEARIIAVADVVEAIASYRPYRPALGIEAALVEIEKHKGSYYDVEVVDDCLDLFRNKGYKFVDG
jgi:PAS domain S-box-containing protein